MSTKHYFPETLANTLVPGALKALTIASPQLGLIESEKVVYSVQHDPSNVTVISGGGSGHEPAWSGYVGEGLLSAAACGDIFASPSTKQVMAAMKACPSSEGIILMITNYTGDKLHFGLAAERAKSEGMFKNIAVLPQTDDVSIGRSKSSTVGRRGMPGHVIGMKIVGGAASKKYSFERCVSLGRALNDQTVSIGSALDHCHVPGRQSHQAISDDTCVVGAGIHNEPGQQHITPFPPVEDVIDRCLRLLCDPNDTERAFVKFDADDSVVLLVNNYGGLSNLELGALTSKTLEQLDSKWNIKPARIFSGSFETSLNAPGFSISLCNLSKAAAGSESQVTELLELLDLKTTAPAWPATTPAAIRTEGAPPTGTDTVATQTQQNRQAGGDITIEPNLLDTMIRTGCEAAIAAEPNLTKWDMVMGDGDCGEAVHGVSQAIIRILDGKDLPKGSLFDLLSVILDAVDDMGGTLGAILGILLSAFSFSLRTHVTKLGTSPPEPIVYAQALSEAVTTLKAYTSAREGDRTVMDVLLPFADKFAEAGDFHAAVEKAHEQAEATRLLKPRFGRATYVAEAAGQALPDPGAWALYEMLSGMSNGIKSFK